MGVPRPAPWRGRAGAGRVRPDHSGGVSHAPERLRPQAGTRPKGAPMPDPTPHPISRLSFLVRVFTFPLSSLLLGATLASQGPVAPWM